jgi:polar amino acid transport system substrate-binding protein
LVALQYGEADAYFGHDSFLYGMRLQDPTVVILSDLLDPALTVSHYGIAISREHEDFVRFVNAVLDDLIERTAWQQSADTWIEGVVGIPHPTPPAADYRRVD